MKEKLLVCAVRSIETDTHLGYTAVDPEAGVGGQFASLNLQTREEAETLVRKRHEEAQIRLYWPGFEDPEVISLANSKEFDPGGEQNVEIEQHLLYRRLKAAENIARRRAGLSDYPVGANPND